MTGGSPTSFNAALSLVNSCRPGQRAALAERRLALVLRGGGDPGILLRFGERIVGTGRDGRDSSG